MIKRFSINFTVFSIGLDAIMVLASIILMRYVRVILNPLPFIAELPPNVQYPAWIYAVFPLVWVASLAGFSIYDGKKNFRIVDELGTLTFASLVAAISQAGLLFLTFRDFSRALFLLIVAASFLLCGLWRLVARLVFRLRKETLDTTRRLLLIGTGNALTRIKKNLSVETLDSPTRFEVLDLESLPTFKGDPSGLSSQTLESFRSTVIGKNITDVVVSLPRNANAWIDAIATALDDLPLGVWISLDYFDLSISNTRVESLAGLPLLGLRTPALDDYSRVLKRAFDLSIVLPLCLIAIPVILLVSLLVLLIDGRPVFFKQKRIGENGKVFDILKFRTMLINAEDIQSQVTRLNSDGQTIHKTPDDPRVTKLGRILRRFSLDEVPQIINVIKGEMSLVGPRPELPHLVQQYEHWQRRRLSVPPGITGWWQVNGRSEKVMHLHTEEDIYYVENYSIWLDINILIRTIWVVIVGKGSF